MDLGWVCSVDQRGKHKHKERWWEAYCLQINGRDQKTRGERTRSERAETTSSRQPAGAHLEKVLGTARRLYKPARLSRHPLPLSVALRSQKKHARDEEEALRDIRIQAFRASQSQKNTRGGSAFPLCAEERGRQEISNCSQYSRPKITTVTPRTTTPTEFGPRAKLPNYLLRQTQPHNLQPQPPPTMTFLMTAGNAGAGYYSIIALAKRGDEVKKMILTSRSKEKAEAAISNLMDETGKPRGWFEYVVLDLTDYRSCLAAAEALPSGLDRICLSESRHSCPVKLLPWVIGGAPLSKPLQHRFPPVKPLFSLLSPARCRRGSRQRRHAPSGHHEHLHAYAGPRRAHREAAGARKDLRRGKDRLRLERVHTPYLVLHWHAPGARQGRLLVQLLPGLVLGGGQRGR